MQRSQNCILERCWRNPPLQNGYRINDVRDVLAYWIRLLRVEKGWSQERLAHECSLDRTYVSAVERSRWNVSLANIERMGAALGDEAVAIA